MTIAGIGGKPKKWKSVDQLEKLIKEYWEYIELEKEIPDVEGLAVYLKTTRKTLYEYENDPEYSNTIKTTKEKIFHRKKQAAFKGLMNPTIFIFDAKNNHGYKDKQEIEQTVQHKSLKDVLATLSDGT